MPHCRSLLTTVVIARRWRTIVSNSAKLSPTEPSPVIHNTWREGWASLAAIENSTNDMLALSLVPLPAKGLPSSLASNTFSWESPMLRCSIVPRWDNLPLLRHPVAPSRPEKPLISSIGYGFESLLLHSFSLVISDTYGP